VIVGARGGSPRDESAAFGVYRFHERGRAVIAGERIDRSHIVMARATDNAWRAMAWRDELRSSISCSDGPC